jgi:hypothetical protein
MTFSFASAISTGTAIKLNTNIRTFRIYVTFAIIEQMLAAMVYLHDSTAHVTRAGSEFIQADFSQSMCLNKFLPVIDSLSGNIRSINSISISMQQVGREFISFSE